jgi:hypothetical protein
MQIRIEGRELPGRSGELLEPQPGDARPVGLISDADVTARDRT